MKSLREKKLNLYQKKPTGYIAYINFWVWIILACSVIDMLYGATRGMDTIHGVVHVIMIAFVLICSILIRDPEPVAYWINLSMLIVVLIKSFVFAPYNALLATTAAFENVDTSGGIFSGLMHSFNAMITNFVFSALAWVTIILSIVYIILFLIHRHFYVTSIKTLQKELEEV